MKTFNTTLRLLTLAPCFFYLLGCQSETADLHRADRQDIEASVSDISIGEPETPEVTQSNIVIPDLPEAGQVSSVQVVLPPEISEVEPADVTEIEQTIALTNPDIKPKLDLVFIMDDSKSMLPHQENLIGAMDQFVDELSNYDLLDYRISVIPIYDSRRYFKQGRPGEQRYIEGVTEFSRPTRGEENFQPKRNFYRLGTMVPLRQPTDNDDGFVELDEFFATSETKSEVLKATLKLGAQNFIEADQFEQVEVAGPVSQQDQAQGEHSVFTEILLQEAIGPRYEELLAPMVMGLNPGFLMFGTSSEHYRAQFPDSQELGWSVPAIDDEDREDQWMAMTQSMNSDFVRSGAHLGVIFITDTIDWSPNLNAQRAAEALQRLKGDDRSYEKISTYGVLHRNSVSRDLQTRFGGDNDPDNPWSLNKRHCVSGNPKVDDDVRNQLSQPEPQELEKFLNITRGNREAGTNILNICDGTNDNTYGRKLARVAKDLFTRSVSRGEYRLQRFPAGRVEVVYKSDPERNVPFCQSERSQELCWTLEIRPGAQNIVFVNQGLLGTQELLVRYQSIDPLRANEYNSRRVTE